RTAGASIGRMEGRAALCHVLLQGELRELGLEPSVDSPQVAQLVAGWINAAAESEYMEVRYSYACYLARTLATRPDSTLAAIASLLNRVCWVAQYQEKALVDPELDDVRMVPQVRAAILQPVRDVWEIRRFAEVRARLRDLGLESPAQLSRSFTCEYVAGALQIDGTQAESLIDASRLLAALLEVSGGNELDEEDRIRAARCLIDVLGHTTTTLAAAIEVAPAGTMAALGRSVYCTPEPEEQEALAQYLYLVVARLASASWQRAARAQLR
ncbi:MAG: hypothetical protein ABW091_15115, partial [Microbacterium sp.]